MITAIVLAVIGLLLIVVGAQAPLNAPLYVVTRILGITCFCLGVLLFIVFIVRAGTGTETLDGMIGLTLP